MSKYEIEIPDIEELKAVMQSHFENGRQEEAWALSEHWTMEYKYYHKLKPRNLKDRELKQQNEGELKRVAYTLQEMYNEVEFKHAPYSYKDRMKEAVDGKKKVYVTYSDPWLYLDFVESKLKQYGNQLEAASDETTPSGFNEKDLIMASMGRMIHDMHLYFDVWTYEDMYNIEDEKMRLKIAELARLYLSYKGIDAAAPPQPDTTYGVHEKSLARLL